MHSSTNFKSTVRPILFLGLLLLATLVGGWLTNTNSAQAEITKGQTRKAFLSGSERSEQVLREIAQILKTMDGRLARLEKLAARPAP
jgi:hypothetical protein